MKWRVHRELEKEFGMHKVLVLLLTLLLAAAANETCYGQEKNHDEPSCLEDPIAGLVEEKLGRPVSVGQGASGALARKAGVLPKQVPWTGTEIDLLVVECEKALNSRRPDWGRVGHIFSLALTGVKDERLTGLAKEVIEVREHDVLSKQELLAVTGALRVIGSQGDASAKEYLVKCAHGEPWRERTLRLAESDNDMQDYLRSNAIYSLILMEPALAKQALEELARVYPASRSNAGFDKPLKERLGFMVWVTQEEVRRREQGLPSLLSPASE